MRTIGIGLILAATVLAAPLAWGQQAPGRGGPRGGEAGRGFDGVTLLSQKSVQEELKLTDEQAKQVADHTAKQRQSFGELRDLSREERQKRMTESREQNQKMVSSLLNEDQQKRLRQIALQLQGAQALASPEVVASLDLSDEQKKSVEEIQTASREEMRAAFQAGGGDREAARKKFQEARQATGDKLKAVLTAEQQAKWQDMLGEPFQGELRGPGGSGQGQRQLRRSRDGAATRPATTTPPTVLTADQEEDKPKVEGDAQQDDAKQDGAKQDGAKQDGAKAKKDARQRDKHPKKPGQKQAVKRGHRHESQARHHRGSHGPRAMHARHGRPGHGSAAHRKPGDARSEAWAKVARAMHQDRQRSFSHHGRRGHHGHAGFQAARPHYGRYAQAHRMSGHRHMAGVSRDRHHCCHQGMASHQHRRPTHAFRGHAGDGQRGGYFASHRHHGQSGHGHHGNWQRGPRPDEHRFHGYAQRSRQHGPPSWAPGYEYRGPRGPQRGGEMAHHRGHHSDHGRMHMTGFKHRRDSDRSKVDRGSPAKGDGAAKGDTHVRKPHDRKDKDRAVKAQDGKEKGAKDARKGHAKKKPRGDSDSSQPNRPESDGGDK